MWSVTPQQPDAILRKCAVARYECHGFAQRLCDQHAVERVAVVLRKFRDPRDMLQVDVECLNAGGRERSFQRPHVEFKLSQRGFDRDFPSAREAGVNVVLGSLNRPPQADRQLLRRRQRPKQRMI